MADKNRHHSDSEPLASVPSDAELFAGVVQNDYTAQDIFAGDESLYQALANAEGKGNKIDAVTPKTPKSPVEQTPKQPAQSLPRFSLLQKGLAAAIFLVALILAVAVFKTPRNTLADANLAALMDINVQSPTALAAVNEPEKESPQLATSAPAPIEPNLTQDPALEQLAQDTPLSLKIAQDMFETGQYRQAYLIYHQIQQYLPPTNVEAAFYDFLTLHKGLCLAKNQDSIQARRSLSLAAKSSTPSIRVVANYYLSRLELSQNQFMPARARACEALSLLDALPDLNPEWLADLKQTCCYLAAQATSKQALILCDEDKKLPSNLCPMLPELKNPWYNLNETQVYHALSKESSLLPSILLTPKFARNEKTPQTPWSVSCHRMAIDELLARFGANTSREVIWHEEANYAEFRQQAVTLCIENVSDQTVVSLAAGSSGLLALIGEDQMIHVMNPVTTTLVSDQITMLAQEATGLWQRYLFSSLESPYFANAHFTSGLLYKQLGLRAEALSEFKLVASRYSRSNLAPYALLYSSQVKEELHDAVGVQKDLKLLVEQYPDVPIVTQAFLRLADTVAQLGQFDEAAKLYRKVFYLNLSDDSRVTAALSAGRCFFQTKEYESAELWLTQYIQMTQGLRAKEVYSAYYSLGKSLMALNKPQLACQAFHNALKGELSKTDYMDTLASLVQGYMDQQDLMEAIDVLEDAFNVQLAPSDMLELNLLKSSALRGAGLVDRAIELLQNSKGSVADPYLNAKLSYELSLSLIEKGDLQQAQKELSNTLVKVESGPLAHKVALTLAQVCLDLKQEAQAVSVCQSVLELQPDQALSQKAAELMAQAYTNQQNYDKAAQTLIGQWN